MSDVTQILNRIDGGDPAASEQLLPLVYDELRRLASQRMAQEKPGQTLQATALVHDAYIRLVGTDSQPTWDSRGHFFAAAAEAMRRILIENARRKQATKRGGEWHQAEMELDHIAGPDRNDRLVQMDEALCRLEEQDEVKANLVKLRYFAGLTNAQAAESLGISTTTADRYWAYSRAWLKQEMDEK